MKKVLSILLALVMIFSLMQIAFAAEEVTPIVVVRGMGSEIYEGEVSEENKVYPPSSGEIAKAVGEFVPALTRAVLTKDYSKLGNSVSSIKVMFEKYSCDENGNLNSNVTAKIYPESMAVYYDEFLELNDPETGMCCAFADEIGKENVYYFNYVWSQSPFTHAEALNKYIENVLSETGAKQVSIIACSMGGTIAMSYLYKYGNSKIKNLVLASTAFQGTEIVGQLFTKDVDIDILDALRYFGEFLGYDFIQTLVTAAQKGIKPSIFSSVNSFFDELVAGMKEVAFSDVFMDTFVTMPGVWALMPASYYEDAKAELFTDRDPYAFMKEIDEYMYFVQSKAENIIADARNSGSNVYIVATYFCPGIPLYENNDDYTDNLIDLKYASGGATVAKYGEKLSGTTNLNCGDASHSHLSADKVVDTSSCMLPEQTWIIRNVGHMNYYYGTGLCSLLVYLMTSEDEVSVHSNELYPQFTEFNNVTKALTPLEDHTPTSAEFSWANILVDFIARVIKVLFSVVLK